MSLLIHLTPFLILILLYRLCPAHFPPSTTTSRLFLLYTLSCHLLAHRTSPWSLIQNLALLIFAHILIAAIYFLHYLAKFACYTKHALLPIYEDVAESIQLSVRNVAAHIHATQLDEYSRDRNLDKDDNEDYLTDELEIDSEPESDPEPYKHIDLVDDTIIETLPPEEIIQLRQEWTSSVTVLLQAAFLRLHEFTHFSVLYVLHFYSMCLSHIDSILSLYEQAALALYIRRTRLVLITRRSLEPFCRMFSNFILLGNIYTPAIAVFALHFIFWTILLSIGELYALSLCILCIFWILSWLS
ncbi:hypothetical protein GGI35DRAFT_492055 [Trichoderma velutinum]